MVPESSKGDDANKASANPSKPNLDVKAPEGISVRERQTVDMQYCRLEFLIDKKATMEKEKMKDLENLKKMKDLGFKKIDSNDNKKK